MNTNYATPSVQRRPPQAPRNREITIEFKKKRSKNKFKGKVHTGKGSWFAGNKKDLPPGGYGKPVPGTKGITVKTDKKNKCKATIYLHFCIDVDFASDQGCTDEDIQSFIDAIEEGMDKHWKNSQCKCEPPLEGPGCTFSVEAVWHETPTTRRPGTFSLKVKCKPPAEADPDEGITGVSPRRGGTPTGPRYAGGLYAHEIGHLMFGTGKKAPYNDRESKKKGKTPWDKQGHNPKDDGLMHGNPIDPSMKPSQEEICILVAKFELCDMEKDCCKKPKKGSSGKGKGEPPQTPSDPILVEQATVYYEPTGQQSLL